MFAVGISGVGLCDVVRVRRHRAVISRQVRNEREDGDGKAFGRAPRTGGAEAHEEAREEVESDAALAWQTFWDDLDRLAPEVCDED